MKKHLALLLALVMLISLTSCGGGENKEDTTKDNEKSTVDAQKVIEEELEKAEELDSSSVEAVEYYLKKGAGIKFSDIEPEWEYTVSDYGAYANGPSGSTGHAVINFTKADGEITDDEYDKWYSQLFNATAKVSDDGYNIVGYEFAGEGEDAEGKANLEEALKDFLKGWAFRYKGKILVVYVSAEYDNDKESEIGKWLYYNGAKVDIGVGLQKSMSETLSEAESYLEENEEEIEKALNEYLN